MIPSCLLAAAASHDFFKGEHEIEERVTKARALRTQRMEDGRTEALLEFEKVSPGEPGEAFEDFLMEKGRCDDLIDDLYADDSESRFEGENEYEEHFLMQEKAALKSFELSFRLLRELPEVLQLAAAPVAFDDGREADNKKRKAIDDGKQTGTTNKHQAS